MRWGSSEKTRERRGGLLGLFRGSAGESPAPKSGTPHNHAGFKPCGTVEDKDAHGKVWRVQAPYPQGVCPHPATNRAIQGKLPRGVAIRFDQQALLCSQHARVNGTTAYLMRHRETFPSCPHHTDQCTEQVHAEFCITMMVRGG